MGSTTRPKPDRISALRASEFPLIPGLSQTLSKGPKHWGKNFRYVSQGRGAHIIDTDGRMFLDWPMGLGSNILGYCHPEVNAAIATQLNYSGINFTLPHELEPVVAQKIINMCPGVEQVRFLKTGSEAVSAAVRVARAYTGRDLILIDDGYHGWHDWFIASQEPALGVPRVSRRTIRRYDLNLRDAAGFVFEPDRVPDWQLVHARANHKMNGIVTVADEVITGFRVAPGGWRESGGARPDLSVYGKALGNGMPIAAVAGSHEVMETFEDVYVSGTHAGEALSLAAASVVLDILKDGTVLNELGVKGERLRGGLQHLGYVASGYPQRLQVTHPEFTKDHIRDSLFEKGILFNGNMFMCAAHTDEDIDRSLEAFEQVGK